MGFRGGGQIDPPPSISWFSSTPAGIGLIFPGAKKAYTGNLLINISLGDSTNNVYSFKYTIWIFAFISALFAERGKGDSPEPPLFPPSVSHIWSFILATAMSHHNFPFQAVTFDYSGHNYILKRSLKRKFQKSSRVTIKT